MYLNNTLHLKGDVFFNMLIPGSLIFTFQFFSLLQLLFTGIHVGTIATGLQMAEVVGKWKVKCKVVVCGES